ncbi:cytochrome ubiquinol oxidase subunit I [Patulibacter brassicae]|uniref:Cytochrome ubiquinol oxidase subunit I n=1 Tax=Patulibacter brassicae TaxID=1705717 RepID=A0ABU4VFU3_9ACTN|nr:cytochrome ubiquinol oxidase subunit I [Patulibacter brassicae]MDX8150569.1 cytochrome ubiquinol oxidase subunit I [Patulibacter brassicae]
MPSLITASLTALDLSRWQFALTTLIHFSIVAASIGLTVHVAILQTRWWRTGDEQWLRLTRYYARPMLICFAIGVVTGLLQTFQFGMNWSGFSRYLGDIFGAPLALEGLGAFFVESVFLGLWLFGWGVLGPRLHLACLWTVAIATVVSAFAILTANSWMQHPRGYAIVDGRAEVTDVAALFLNPDVGLTVAHVVLTAILTGSVLVLAIAAWQVRRGHEVAAFRRAATQACAVGLVAGALALVAGHFQGVRAVEHQPMKMAAAEALYSTESPASLSLFALGPIRSDPGEPTVNVKVPALLSLIDDFSLDSTVLGIDDLQREYAQRYGPGSYVPNVPLLYWSFRLMVGSGAALVLLMGWGLWLLRRRPGAGLTDGRGGRLFLRVAPLAAVAPFVAAAGGWLVREAGRQPWAIQGLLRTEDAVSDLPVAAVATSLVVFLAIYLATTVIGLRTIRRELAHGLPEATGATPRDPVARPAAEDRDDASTGRLSISY